jgi:hypothetical protein
MCFFGSLSIAEGLDKDDKVLSYAVKEGIQANVAKLDSAVITWRSELIHYGALADRIGPEESYQLEKGTHQLWWNGEKIAANKRSDYLRYGENIQPSVFTHQVRMAYDGKIFRTKSPRPKEPEKSDVALYNKPQFKHGDNYLRDIGWQNFDGPLMAALKEPTEPGTRNFSTEVGEDGSKLIKQEFYNSRTAQVGFWYYDVDKSCVLIRSEYYCGETPQLQQRTNIRYEQIQGGAWFPVEVMSTGFNITNGEKISCNKTVVDISKSVFNDLSAVPDEVFELEIGKNAEVSDFLHGERLLYSTSANPIETEVLKGLVDDFVVSDEEIKEEINGEIKEKNNTGYAERIGIKPTDDSHTHDGHTHQHKPLDNETSWRALSLIFVGVVACVIGIVVWMRRF